MKNIPNHRQLFYSLKRAWGERVLYYRLSSETTDVRTGKTVRRYRVLDLRKVAILPNKKDRSFVYDLDWIQAGRNFTKGGFFDRNARSVVLDARDLPKHFIPKLEDFMSIRGKRYMITVIEELERLSGYGLKITTVENKAREKWVLAKSCVDFDASVTA